MGREAARAAPDGYSIGIGAWNTHVVNGAIYTLPYHVLNDFEPVALLANNHSLIVSKTAVPSKDLTELIAWIKANEGKVSAGTGGAGASKTFLRGRFRPTHRVAFPPTGGRPCLQGSFRL